MGARSQCWTLFKEPIQVGLVPESVGSIHACSVASKMYSASGGRAQADVLHSQAPGAIHTILYMYIWALLESHPQRHVHIPHTHALGLNLSATASPEGVLAFQDPPPVFNSEILNLCVC